MAIPKITTRYIVYTNPIILDKIDQISHIVGIYKTKSAAIFKMHGNRHAIMSEIEWEE